MDDLKLSGPEHALKDTWKQIAKVIDIEDPAPPGRYLGCKVTITERMLPKIGRIKEASYDMEDNITTICDDYIGLVSKITGKPFRLGGARTPFQDEDQHLAEARKPAECLGDAFTCPWCKHTFPEECGKETFELSPPKKKPKQSKEHSSESIQTTKARKTKKGAKRTMTSNLAPGEEGQLVGIAASILMRALYVARCARYDLLKSINALASYVQYWDRSCDAKLHRLVNYCLLYTSDAADE